jgi:hypothetical protein
MEKEMNIKRIIYFGIFLLGTGLGFLRPVYADIPTSAKADPRYDLGYLVVTYYQGVNSDGTGDSRAGIQEAIDDAFNNKLVVFFPPGTYQVSDVLKCYYWAFWNPKKGRANNPPHKKTHVLQGSSMGASRPVIKLSKGASGFDNPSNPRPVLVWRYFSAINANGTTKVEPEDPLNGVPENFDSQPNVIFGWEVRNIDIDLSHHAGAIGGAFKSAQYSDVLDMRIDAEGGYCGIYGVPGRNSFVANIEVEGGRYGVYNNGSAAGACLVGAKLYNQTEYAVTSEDFCPYSLVGFEIVTNAPRAIFVRNEPWWSSGSGTMTLVEGTIHMQNGGTAVDNTHGRTIHLSQVYIKGADQLVKSGSMAPVTGSEDWMHVIEYTYNDQRPPSGNNVFSTYSLIDGEQDTTAEPLTNIEAGAPTQNLVSRHTWDQLPSFEGEDDGTIDVKKPPYNAKGDGVTDDRSAIQQAINDAPNGKVFLPKGYYVISQPLVLKSNTKLFGVNQNFSNLVSTSAWSAGHRRFMVETVNDANAGTFFGFIGFEDRATASYNTTGGFIHWRAGRNSMIMTCWHEKQWGPFFGTNARHNYQFTGHAGGRHYITPGGNDVALNADSRHVYIEGTSEPLTFYGLNVESTKRKKFAVIKKNTNVEVVNASNIRFHSMKREATSPSIIIRDSHNIGFYGMGRLNNPVEEGMGGYIQIYGSSSDIVFATIVLDHRGSDRIFPLLTEHLDGENEINISWPSNLSVYKRGELSDIYKSSNMLSNSGFELGSSYWSLGNNCSIINNSGEAYNGSYSLGILANGSTWNGANQIVDVIAGHKYEIKGYIRSHNITGDAPRLRARYYSASNGLLLNQSIKGVTGTTGYVLYSATITAPANAVRLKITPLLSNNTNSGGIAWYDDLSVIDQDAEPTT